jgi:hypothetical protein
MDKQERKEIILDVIEVYKGLSESMDMIDNVFHNSDGPLSDYAFRAVDGYIEYASKCMNIDPEVLFWFIYDDNCGERGLKITDGNKTICKITGVDCLIQYLDEWYPYEQDKDNNIV